MMSEYQSSEELQRHNADVFANKAAEKKAVDTTTNELIKKVLDKYIAEHKSTVSVRKMAKESGRTADEQLNLSADVVEILEKIKGELR